MQRSFTKTRSADACRDAVLDLPRTSRGPGRAELVASPRLFDATVTPEGKFQPYISYVGIRSRGRGAAGSERTICALAPAGRTHRLTAGARAAGRRARPLLCRSVPSLSDSKASADRRPPCLPASGPAQVNIPATGSPSLPSRFIFRPPPAKLVRTRDGLLDAQPVGPCRGHASCIDGQLSQLA
jgi:hypothetical protein